MHKALPVIGGLCLLFSFSQALAAETVTYAYDVKGRLDRAFTVNWPNNGTITTYDHDKADSRKIVKMTGALR
jgi:hypothetical protein